MAWWEVIRYQLLMPEENLSHNRVWYPGGGGTQSGKGYRLRSDRWRAVAVATPDKKKRGAVLISYCRIGVLSQPVQLIFHVK